MVSLKDVEASNARIGTTFPPNIVAVFVGATSGIGETTLIQFAEYTTTLHPRVYFIGRSQEAGDGLVDVCKKLNPNGEFNFIQADTSLIRNVDEVCRQIANKEKYINILCMSTGSLLFNTKTSEGLHMAASLVTYSRNRFANNLLPLLSAAPPGSLRRVVTVFAAGYEGPIDTNNIQCFNISMMSQRPPTSSIVTLSLEELSKKAPTVSFIHSFPSMVQTGIGRDLKLKGPVKWLMNAVMFCAGFFLRVPIQESGDRHLFLATSARYPAREGKEGVKTADGFVARGTDGKVGSGVYSVNEVGESSGPKVEELLAEFRKNGVASKVWKNMEEEWERITKSVEG